MGNMTNGLTQCHTTRRRIEDAGRIIIQLTYLLIRFEGSRNSENIFVNATNSLYFRHLGLSQGVKHALFQTQRSAGAIRRFIAGHLSAQAYEQDKTYKITILHTNDHHGHFWRNDYGEYGLAAQKTLVDGIRKEVAAEGGKRPAVIRRRY
ncbi:UDP-sugar hydrolase [Klebsiella pneumoniae]|uniref:UDP-sugar hydrolase n=1 Tax=Klebsiella pneumoniae TaxID=573 RepID=A0A377WI75_KLEPN|nr:UDP-sugar hydrolase [Klebsiella pneumoniae]